MSYIVVLKDTKVIAHGTRAEKVTDKTAPENIYTEEQAESRCRKANDDAEALGIKARYEVAPA